MIGGRKTRCSTLLAMNWRQHGCDSMRSRSTAAPVNLSTIERSPPPKNWRPRSPRLSRRVADDLRATGRFEQLLEVASLLLIYPGHARELWARPYPNIEPGTPAAAVTKVSLFCNK